MIFVVHSPSVDEVQNGYDYQGQFVRRLRNSNFNFIEMREALVGEDLEEVYYDDAHLDVRGHEIYGEVIAERLAGALQAGRRLYGEGVEAWSGYRLDVPLRRSMKDDRPEFMSWKWRRDKTMDAAQGPGTGVTRSQPSARDGTTERDSCRPRCKSLVGRGERLSRIPLHLLAERRSSLRPLRFRPAPRR